MRPGTRSTNFKFWLGQSIEKSLEAFEKQSSGLRSEQQHSVEHAQEAQEALHKLHKYLDAKSQKLGDQSEHLELKMREKLRALRQSSKDGLEPGLEAKILAALDEEINTRQEDDINKQVEIAKLAKEKAEAAYEKAMKAAAKAKKAAELKEHEAKLKASAASAKETRDLKLRSVADVYERLKSQKRELNEKNSEIDKMRKEIAALRRAVEELRKEGR